MISVLSGGLVPQSNPNQSVMNMLGVPKYTVNTLPPTPNPRFPAPPPCLFAVAPPPRPMPPPAARADLGPSDPRSTVQISLDPGSNRYVMVNRSPALALDSGRWIRIRSIRSNPSALTARFCKENPEFCLFATRSFHLRKIFTIRSCFLQFNPRLNFYLQISPC
jgi:hypothetical protein